MNDKQVEDAILKALKLTPNLMMTEIDARIDAPSEAVKNAVRRLCQKKQIEASRSKAWRLKSPAEPETVKKSTISKVLGTYDGAELRRPVGIADERFRAFALPSRMGSRLVCPKGAL
jgi:predicted transcriptional regulator